MYGFSCWHLWKSNEKHGSQESLLALANIFGLSLHYHAPSYSSCLTTSHVPWDETTKSTSETPAFLSRRSSTSRPGSALDTFFPCSQKNIHGPSAIERHGKVCPRTIVRWYWYAGKIGCGRAGDAAPTSQQSWQSLRTFIETARNTNIPKHFPRTRPGTRPWSSPLRSLRAPPGVKGQVPSESGCATDSVCVCVSHHPPKIPPSYVHGLERTRSRSL